MFEPIPIAEFLRRTEVDANRDLAHDWESPKQVVSLRQLETIDAVQLMHIEYLKKLLGRVTFAGGNKDRPYAHCEVKTMHIAPRAARIGQRFVERAKYSALLEGFGELLSGFAIPGTPSDIGAFIALGRLKDGTRAIAHYVPPILEIGRDNRWTLLDGIHRNFVVERMGATTPVVAIQDVEAEIPFDLHDWSKVCPVDEKPPPDSRYFNLKEDLFRDLKHVGIDG